MFVVKCEKGYFKMNTKRFKDTSYFVGFTKKPQTFFTSKEQARNTVLDYDITHFEIENASELEMKQKLESPYPNMDNERLLALYDYYSIIVAQYTSNSIVSNSVGTYNQIEYSRLKTENELLKITVELMKRKLI